MESKKIFLRTGNQQEMKFQHDVYICFSDADAEAVEILETALTNYAPHPEMGFAHRHLRVFLDSPEVAKMYQGEIFTQPLQHSKKFLAAYSPETRRDPQMNQQIRDFLAVREAADIVPVLFAKSGESENVLPEAMADASISTRPVVIRQIEKLAHPASDAGTFESWLTLLSRLSTIDVKTLSDLELKRQNRSKKLRMSLIIGAALSLVFLTLFWWLQQRATATQELNNARAQQLLNESRVASLDNNPLLRLHFLAAAYDQSPESGLMSQISTQLKEVWPVAKLVQTIKHPAQIAGVLPSPDSSNLLIWGGNTAQIWQLKSAKNSPATITHSEKISGVAWLPNGDVILSWSNNGEVRRTNLTSGNSEIVFTDQSGILQAHLSPDAQRLVTTADDFTARLWDISTGKLISESPQDGWIGGIAFSPDGDEFLMWSDDSTAIREDSRSGTPISRPMRHSGSLNGGQYHPSGKRVLIWATDGSIQQWALPAQQKFAKTMRHNDGVLGATYVRDGAAILSWSSDETLRMWDSQTGDAITPPFSHDGWVLGAILDDANNRIFSWGFDNTARLWQVNPPTAIAGNMRHRNSKSEASNGIFFGLISPDNRWLVTGGSDGAFRIWDASANAEQPAAVLQHLPADEVVQQLTGAFFVDSGKKIVTWNGDNFVKIWQLLPDDHRFPQDADDMRESAAQWTGTIPLIDGDNYSIGVNP